MTTMSADTRITREMIETPAEIVQKTAEMVATAPYCGLGFSKSRLHHKTYQKMMQQLHADVDKFLPETRIEEICTTEPSVIPALYHEDHAFNRWVLGDLKMAHEEWSGMKLAPSACYGFRVYQRGCYLHNHVDRTQTHIISSTICVDHRLDEPWPLYIEDIEGKACQIDMRPGELVFYEGARLPHGRPWPLKGRYYVGMFVHYRPLGGVGAGA